MSNNKKILLLGGSAQQVPVIQKAKEMGLFTILLDYLPDNPGQYVADKWYQESTTDIEKVHEIAKKEKVNGILAYASDPAALPAAIVSERLGLPTNPSKSVEILGVKHKFRQFLQENGFPSPKTFTFSPTDSIEKIKKGILGLNFPIVVKPTDSSGSKGVSFIIGLDKLEEAIEIADQYSRNKILIAEEFIERGFPYVIGGDIFVENGKITLFGDMGCIRDYAGNGLIPIGKKKPYGLNKKQEENLYKELQQLINALNIKNGEMNIELILDKEDQPHFLELGPRAGGNMIPIQLSDIYGIDLIEANVKAAIGDPINLNPFEPNESFMTHVLHSNVDGVFEEVLLSKEIEPYIYRKVLYKKTGDKVEVFDGAGKALGIIFMCFPNPTIMASILKDINNLIKIKIKK